MPGNTLQDYKNAGYNAAQAVTSYRADTNPHWNDSYLDMGAKLMMQELDNKNQLELWNLMNEYNSPVEQMKRFKEAGLNPMLIYQQGTPGNAGSPADYSSVSPSMHPHMDTAQRIKAASDTISMVTNLAQNIAGLFDTGYNLELKRNEVAQSNYEFAQNLRLPGYGQGRRANVTFFPDSSMTNGVFNEINPFSDSFDPVMYMTLERQGKLPSMLQGLWMDIPRRNYQQSRVDYQKYYNEHLLPLFERYQEGKADIIDIEKEMKEYNKNMLEMIPPEWRGIIEPILQWVSPFFKFIFKRSTVQRYR